MNRAAVNPLRLAHPHLQPGLVMAARVLALGLLLRGDSPFRMHLPYLEVLDGVDPVVVNVLTRGVAGAGCLLILVSPWVRLGAVLAGAAYLTGLLACMPCHSVAHTFVACLLIMIGLSSRATDTSLVRAQVVLLYAGAALHKTLDVDWWNGRYFETFLVVRHDLAIYQAVASRLPEMWLSIALGGVTVVTQWLLAACFAVRVWTRAGIALAVAFHGGMVLLLNATFGPFMIALVAAYVALAWPDSPEPRSPTHGWRARGRSLATSPALVLAATVLLTTEALNGAIRNVTIVVLPIALAALLPRSD